MPLLQSLEEQIYSVCGQLSSHERSERHEALLQRQRGLNRCLEEISYQISALQRQRSMIRSQDPAEASKAWMERDEDSCCCSRHDEFRAEYRLHSVAGDESSSQLLRQQIRHHYVTAYQPIIMWMVMVRLLPVG